MPSPENLTITYEIEPIVKLKCFATDCDHHLGWAGMACCNLKIISIGKKESGSSHECDDYKQKS